MDDKIRCRTHDGRAGDGQDPGRDHLASHIPVDSLDALGCADAHDGAGDDVCRRDGQMEERRREDDDGLLVKSPYSTCKVYVVYVKVV